MEGLHLVIQMSKFRAPYLIKPRDLFCSKILDYSNSQCKAQRDAKQKFDWFIFLYGSDERGLLLNNASKKMRIFTLWNCIMYFFVGDPILLG